MKDDRTEKQKYEDLIEAISICWKHGWKHSRGWIFCSPSGIEHDLSATDLTKLDTIG